MYFLFFSLLFFYYRTFSLHKECRILQLHHYQMDRQISYLMEKKHDWQSVVANTFLHSPFVLLIFLENVYIALILLLLIYILLRFKVEEKKKIHRDLVYTKRILRLYFVLYVLYTFLLYIGEMSHHFLYMVLFLMCINKEMVFLANLIIWPIESMIRLYYMQDAKRKLKAHPGLIKVGIVGSYGKTSSKNILFHLLKENYLCLKSKHSYNNKMGNTLTIRKELRRMHTLFICEMGSDHVGEIEELMHFINPQYVLITSIGNQHLNTFKSQEHIVYEKMSPLLFLKKEDVAILNIDNPYIYRNYEQGICKKITFGEHEEAQYRLLEIEMNEYGSSFKILYNKQIYTFHTTLLGRYNIDNLVGCIALAHTLHVDMEILQRMCRRIQPIEHRLESKNMGKYILIDNAYNSNPYSFKNSMEVLSKIKKYRILITPGIIDVKEDDYYNEMIMEDVVHVCEEVVLVGKRNRNAMVQGLKTFDYLAYQCVDTMEEALDYVNKKDMSDYVVLIENDIDKTLMNL